MWLCKFADIGYGMTEKEAYQDAIKRAEVEFGKDSGHINSIDKKYKLVVKRVSPPKPPRRSIVKRSIKSGGRRKWTKGYSLYAKGNLVGSHGDREEAIKIAKDYSAKNQIVVDIEMEMFLLHGESRIATVTPRPWHFGKWLFRGTARNNLEK